MKKLFFICAFFSAFCFQSSALAADFTQEGTFVSATQYGGILVYAQRDSANAYSLWQKNSPSSPAIPLVIPSMKDDPKPDLGTLRDGRVLLVYSQDGRLYQYDLASTERKIISGVHAGGQSEVVPTLWKGTLGFWRHGSSGTDGTYRLFTLYSNRHTRSVKRLASYQNFEGADLSDSGLAMSVNGFNGSRDLRTASIQQKPPFKSVRNINVQHSGLGSSVFMTNPTWKGDNLYWGFSRRGSVPSRDIYRANVMVSPVEIKHNVIQRHFSTPANFQALALDNNTATPDSPVWYITTRSLEQNYKSTLFDLPFADSIVE